MCSYIRKINRELVENNRWGYTLKIGARKWSYGLNFAFDYIRLYEYRGFCRVSLAAIANEVKKLNRKKNSMKEKSISDVFISVFPIA